MVETVNQEQALRLDCGSSLCGTRFEAAGEKNQLNCDVLCVPYPWSQAKEVDFWLCKTCPENCRCNCCNFSCECVVCSRQFQCCNECFNKYGREGVAEAGSVSAKLYQLYAMIANDSKNKTVDEFSQCLQSIPLEVVSKRSIRSWTELGTLLQQAVYKEKIDHIRSLLDLGVDPTATSQAEARSPMGLAVELGKDPKVLNLFKQFVPMTDELKLEELFYRMNADDSESVGDEFHQMLNTLPVELLSKTCVCESGTLLQHAIWKGKSEHAFLLLEAGVDPQRTCSVTHIEGYHSHSGDEVTINIGNTGETRERMPVEIAFDTHNEELFDRLAELTGVSDYIRLARLVHELQDYPEPVPAPTETFQENLKLVDLEFANSYPCHWARWGTLLQTAVEEGKAEHLRLILERGVDPFVTAQFPLLHPSKYQRLPLFIACERKNMEMVKILEEYMNMTDDLKLKQLAHYILGDGRESASDEFFKILSTLPLDLVSQSNVQTSRGQGTLLQQATSLGKKGHVRLLVEFGVNTKAVIRHEVEEAKEDEEDDEDEEDEPELQKLANRANLLVLMFPSWC